MSVLCVTIFWVVNASSGEKSCLQFSIPTGSGAGGEGGVSHALNIHISLFLFNTILATDAYTEKKVCWIKKTGVSRCATLICCELNTIRNWINYFIDWKQKHNNKMYALNYVELHYLTDSIETRPIRKLMPELHTIYYKSAPEIRFDV